MPIKNETTIKLTKLQNKVGSLVKLETLSPSMKESETPVSPPFLLKTKKEKSLKPISKGNPFNFTSNFFGNVSVGYDVLIHTFQYLKVQVFINSIWFELIE